MKKFLIFMILAVLSGYGNLYSQKIILPEPSNVAGYAQKKQIDRKYGMFVHFGMNTFHDMEWTDGTKDPASYAPKQIDAEQWVRVAKEAGMKYLILITKHHDGFCLWDSKYTDYDVASSKNTTNVVEAVAKACKKYKMGLGLYYSLWDRHENKNVEDRTLDAAYNAYMLKQLEELLSITGKYTHVVEFWFDGGWTKPNYRWPIMDIYSLIKRHEKDCQVGVNWSIADPNHLDRHALPGDQKEGFPIRYFPSDFRLGDPYLPSENDPKIFTYDGKDYYMPWESTICISQKWFYNTKDNKYKSVDELEKIYYRATANDNILILNCPPNREGRIREKDIELLQSLRKRINR